jgi:Zn-dependent metalloprotease
MHRHVAEHGDPQQREDAGLALGRNRVPVGTPALMICRGEGHSKALRKFRRVFNAGGEELLPGDLVLAEQSFQGEADLEATEVFHACGATFDLFATAFRRNSIDNRGMTIDATVHFGHRCANAFWNGRQVIFGDGDGTLFTRFTRDMDIVGHELAHGFIQHSVRLPYRGEPGALCEHLADVFGMMVKQFAMHLAARDSDWLIGRNLLGPSVRGSGIRSMIRPGTAYDDPVLGRDPQPSHVRAMDHSPEDNGGVHINSGIPNFAFAFASCLLGGYTWDLLGRVWYHVLTTRLRPDATFSSFASDTIDAAGRLFGDSSDVQDAVICGWTCAGVRFKVPELRKRTFIATPRIPLGLCVEAMHPGRPSTLNTTNDTTNNNHNTNDE